MSNDNLELADALHSTAIRLLRSVRHVDQISGLTPARLSAMSVLVIAGPLTVGRLAAAEGVKSPTMTGIVNGLVAEGLAERRKVLGDLRAIEVAVTEAGERLFNVARVRRIEAVAELLENLSESDLERIRATVSALGTTLSVNVIPASGS